MPFGESDLDVFASLTRAIGLTDASGANSAWFTDPVGGSAGNPTGLATVVSDDDQREALLAFVDEVLGPPDARTDGDSRWIPLFRETDPAITLYAVVEAVTGAVRVGVGLEHSTGDTGPRVTSRVHVPLVHLPRGSADSRPSGGATPRWLLLGRPGGRIRVEVDATFTDDPPVPREPFLRGASIGIGIPTDTTEPVEFTLDLRDLQLPGAAAPQTQRLSLDDLDEVGADVLSFLLGLVRAQVAALDLGDPALAAVAGLAGTLGLRDGVADLPALPLADLPTRGMTALVAWVEQVLTGEASRDSWLGQLALLTGGTALPGRDAVRVDLGDVGIVVGLRVTPGTDGHPVLLPWVEALWDTRAGAALSATIDVLRADTGSGSVTAVPAVRLEAVLGADAPGGAPLVPTGPARIGSLHVGAAYAAATGPALVLTLTDVDIEVAGSSQHHDVLDVSSPEAALDAVDDVLDGVLADALAGLGDAGVLLGLLVGVSPPVGVASPGILDLVSDPLGAVRRYWQALVASDAAATAVIGAVGHLLTGTAPAAVSGDGTWEVPWRVDVADGVGLRFWRSDGELVVALGLDAAAPVLDGFTATAQAHLTLARVDLAGGRVAFLPGGGGQLLLGPSGEGPARLDLGGPVLELDGVGVEVLWSAATGFRVGAAGRGLALLVPDPATPLRLPVPLPVLGGDGTVTFAPDWAEVERLLTQLGTGLRVPALDALLGLLGWTGPGAHLPLAGLVADPAAAIEAWSLDLALDCGHLREVLAPVAWLLSAGRLEAPLGAGQPGRPYRCPVAGAPAAPGLAAWTVPGCPPPQPVALGAVAGADTLLDGSTAPDGSALADAIRLAGAETLALADLTVARPRLAEGLDALLARWAGTDGLLAPPVAMPAAVGQSVLDGYGYAELVAAARTDAGALDDIVDPPGAVVHVGCDPDWLTGATGAAAIDATPATDPPAIPAGGDGPWFVRVPAPALAASEAADHDGVRVQAERVAAVLVDRTEPVLLVGYGGAGAAAVRAASLPGPDAVVAAVVTVGTPWSPLATASLNTGLGGDALRLLESLLPVEIPAWDDDLLASTTSPHRRGIDLVRRARSVPGPGDLPAADGEARRAGLAVHAVFGALEAADVSRAVAALVGTGLAERVAAEQAATATGPPQELHLGVDLPVMDGDLGGVTVGIGAALDLLAVHRTAPRLRTLREVVVTLRLGVTDGWLVGGPGASQHDLELRWLDADVHVPLDGRPGSTELVLHDARAFTAYRERWVVRPPGVDGTTGEDATTALPEVRILLGEVLARLAAAAPDLTAALASLGLVRDGGLDPAGLDRLLFDPAATLRSAVAAAPAELAGLLRALTGDAPTRVPATAVRLGAGDATVDLDLATGSLSASAGLVAPGLPAVHLALTADAAGAVLDATVGRVDGAAGGLALVAHLAPGGASLRLDHASPGAVPVPVALYPVADVDALVGVLTPALPAVLLQGLADSLRRDARGAGAAAVESALDALGLLGPVLPNGARATVLPIGLLTDPLAWLRRRADPLTATVAVLDALALVVAPDRGAAAGWPVSEELSIGYAVSAGRLALTADLRLVSTVDAHPVTLGVVAGLDIGTSGAPGVVVTAAVAVDGYGAELGVGGPGPGVRLDLLRPAPASRLPLHPAGPGIGSTLQAGAESLVPVGLNALIDQRTGPVSVAQQAGAALHEVCAGLGLLDGDRVTAALVTTFAAHPGQTLLARLPDLATRGLSALAGALDPAGILVRTSTLPSGALRLTLGATGPVHVDLDGAARALAVGCEVDLGSWGRFALDELRITGAGVSVGVQAGPFDVDLGGIMLCPVVNLRAGVTSSSFTRLLGLGLAVDATGTESVQVQWALDSTAPALVAVGGAGTPQARLLGVAVSLASGLVTEQLGTVVDDRATAILQDVVFTGGGRAVDPGFVAALFAPEALLTRLHTLAWNAATGPQPLTLTIEETVTIGLAAQPAGAGRQRLGLSVSLPPGKRLALADGSVSVHLEVDPGWITADVDPGLSIFVLEGTSTALDLVPGVSVAGLGLRFSSSAGPLLDLGSISLDAVAVNVYAEATTSGHGGGVRLQLDGLAVAPGGSGGGNGVANSLMKDVGSAGASDRPSFSPSVAIQKPPGQDLGFSLRAGDPPGPWWVVVQRQLGPLYVDRIGLDTAESGGRVTRISLLFTGAVSLFGLQAAVDQLSITWHGGDVLSIEQWSVDLMGLAVSADMAGVSLSGGLLKTVEGSSVSYVGMLVGRFAAYGLSVFGGYTNQGGHASFFVFGGVNGPIGGPPAFFLTGIGGGLGINRGLRVPEDITRFGEYPFIQALDPGARPPDKPLDRLRELAEYFPHQMGSFWFAAGISFTSFSLVDGVAVVAVSFGDGLEINLFGLARMALPRPGAAIVSIELALLARFSTREGVFLIRAQLTDNSWLLYEDVRLTGGFAFAIWWKGPLRGQFVLTLGGYHPDFVVPQGYPDVPRLGLVWRISDAIVVKGGSYFALTSEALMAGVDVEVSLDFGWVWARVAFGAHGIVYFDPFWFEVMAYARISAGIDIDLGLFSISLSISIGAQIKVWGPDFAGEAKFEIGPCEVPVSFGSKRRVEPATLDWPAFVEKYLEDAGGGRARAVSAITGRGTLPTSTGGKTGAPSADGSPALPFQVFAEFEVSWTTTLPTAWFDVALDATVRAPLTLSTGAATTLGLAPMGAAGLDSGLVVHLALKNEDSGAWQPVPAALRRLAAALTRPAADPSASRLGTDSFPLGVWGPPKSLGTTAHPLPSTDVVSAGNRLTLVAEVDSLTVGPQIDYYRVEATRRPLPLRATSATRRSFLKTSRDLGIAAPTSTAQALAVARATLFAEVGAAAGGTTDGSGRSALGRAAYTRDRCAPPTFGLLTDGLAAQGGTDGVRSTVAAQVREIPGIRRPFVTAHLTGGAGAVARAGATTVGDGRLKRRPAPTLESVRGRIGTHLPVVLQRTASPALAGSGTVLASAGVPRTDVPGATTTYAGARAGSPVLQGLVAGLGARSGPTPHATGTSGDGRAPRRTAAMRARAEALGSSVRAGDLVVLQCPDASVDVDPGRRPALAVEGSARVVMVAGRTVLVDGDAGTAGRRAVPEVPVPVGTTLVAVHSDGDADATDGCAGWHDRSRVARLGTHVGLAAGCTLTVDAAGAAATMTWSSAGTLVADAREVSTRFTRPVRTVAVALTGTAPRGLAPTELRLLGAEVVTDRSGADLPPVSVVLGASTVLLYRVLPDPEAAAVTVIVTAGGDWAVSGVLGTTEAPEDLAVRLARDGLAGVSAKVLAVTGTGCRITWQDAPSPPPRRARRTRKAPR